MSKSELRSLLFSDANRKPASEPLVLFGADVEVRQPTLAQITKLSKMANKPDNKVPQITYMLVEYCYVPGTDEKLFDEADIPVLSEMPAGPWINAFNTALEKLNGAKMDEAEKNSDATA